MRKPGKQGCGMFSSILCGGGDKEERTVEDGHGRGETKERDAHELPRTRRDAPDSGLRWQLNLI